MVVGGRPLESWMRAIGLLLRCIAFLFNLVLALGLFFLALLVIPSGQHNIELSAIPLDGSKLTYTLLAASIYAFVAMVLALRKSRLGRFPMLAWNLVAAALLLWAPLRGSFTFKNPDQVRTGAYLLLASLVALWGSWLQWRKTGGRR